jgi:uncharacterized membrane protein
MTATAAPPAAAPAPRRRWLWVALIASLAINAVLIGMVARTLWQVRANVALAGVGPDARLPAFVNTLPPERRDVLRKAGAPERPWMMLRPLRLEVRQARADAARLFLADPFDKAAFTAAQTRMFNAETKLREAQLRHLPDIGERMTAAERRAYLHWRGRGGMGWGGGNRRGGGGGGPRNGEDADMPPR